MVSYRLVTSESLQSFTVACEVLLKDGYELVGGVSMRDREYLQAFSKEEAEKDKVIPKKAVKKRTRAKKAVAKKKK